MSSQEQDIREGNFRVALGDLLHAEWNVENAMGYDPNADEGTQEHLNITLGSYSEDSPVPHMAIRGVSETPSTASGYSGFTSSGEGPIQTSIGRVDLNTFVGTDDDLPENSQLLAKRIGLEARAIVHDNSVGVMDPATGELLATNLSCSRPTVMPDPDLPGPEYLARQEVTYELNEDPPERS